MLLKNEQKCENPNLCSICKGLCCQVNACDNAPSDFDYSISKMEKALNTGNYSIDFSRYTANSFCISNSSITLNLESILNANDETFYIRPRNRNRPMVDLIHLEEIEGPCIFWSMDKGCALSYENRPMFGRATIPVLGPKDCQPKFDVKEVLTFCWKPYTELLYNWAKKYFPNDWKIYKDFNFYL